MTRNEWVGGKRPGKFTRPASGYLAAANSGTLLGLMLDSIPTATGEPIDPPLSAKEIERASEEIDRRASKKP